MDSNENEYQFSHSLIATSRKPNVANMDLELCGVEYNHLFHLD